MNWTAIDACVTRFIDRIDLTEIIKETEMVNFMADEILTDEEKLIVMVRVGVIIGQNITYQGWRKD